MCRISLLQRWLWAKERARVQDSHGLLSISFRNGFARVFFRNKLSENRSCCPPLPKPSQATFLPSSLRGCLGAHVVPIYFGTQNCFKGVGEATSTTPAPASPMNLGNFPARTIMHIRTDPTMDASRRDKPLPSERDGHPSRGSLLLAIKGHELGHHVVINLDRFRREL